MDKHQSNFPFDKTAFWQNKTASCLSKTPFYLTETPFYANDQRNSPKEMIIPVIIRLIRQNPMMSFAPNLAIASAGIAQNGCIRLVQASPQAIDIAVREGCTPKAAPAGIIIGACTAHCPPPEGTKTFTKPALRNVSIGKVCWFDTEVQKLLI